jgi:hypothetical protein
MKSKRGWVTGGDWLLKACREQPYPVRPELVEGLHFLPLP